MDKSNGFSLLTPPPPPFVSLNSIKTSLPKQRNDSSQKGERYQNTGNNSSGLMRASHRGQDNYSISKTNDPRRKNDIAQISPDSNHWGNVSNLKQTSAQQIHCNFRPNSWSMASSYGQGTRLNQPLRDRPSRIDVYDAARLGAQKGSVFRPKAPFRASYG